jgi:hypothetical protein
MITPPYEVSVESEGEEHGVVGVTVLASDSYFALAFEMITGATVRLRMSVAELGRLGKLLIEAAEERRLHGDV